MPTLGVRLHSAGPETGRMQCKPGAALLLAVVAAQNALTDSVLADCDTRDSFKELMTQMYNFPKLSCPFQRGEPGGVLR